ncbi:MAG: DUF4293 domain-containing protein [Porphyromonas sp.]|nr:DUF4293 domain-containing protein [Porphyromonas sp.]
MIQRKQTLYLLFSGLLMLLMPFVTIVKVSIPDMIYRLNATGFEDLSGEVTMPSWGLFGLTILIILLSFISIFLYNRRVLQMRITVFNLILKIGFYALAYVYIRSFNQTVLESGGVTALNITVWAAAPLIAVIFDYLAHRGIAIDEKTIKYMDRLR